VIVEHLCTKCGHMKREHRGTVCQNGYCACSAGAYEAGPSQVIPTYDPDDGKHPEILTVTTPGSVWDGARTCSCVECLALAERVAS
jgi:hypothetical protein